ncbi:LuxR C-terminal-related transcriptional regulator [Streptomyces sp. NPDC051784]|uniref:LuxR C-terminal-related transcriptional regulator n=1 Tax=Streptomyces sp. NPDC051784 TaxID=3155805 RepID=UPI00342C15D4
MATADDRREPDGECFVGRDAALRRLREAFREGPRLAVVRGERGTGMSRLVDEVLGSEAAAACTQLRGSCAEMTGPDPAGAAPLAPVADALAGLPRRPGRAVLPPSTGTVSLLVPELADLLPPPPAAAADPEVRRRLLPRAVASLLDTLGDVILVVEDVHRADGQTLALLRHLMSAPPPGLRLLVTECSAPGLPLFAVESGARLPVTEVAVLPWTRAETAEFVRRRPAPHRPEEPDEEEALGTLVHELTGGLPGTAEALLRALECEPEASPARGDGVWGDGSGSPRLSAVQEAGAEEPYRHGVFESFRSHPLDPAVDTGPPVEPVRSPGQPQERLPGPMNAAGRGTGTPGADIPATLLARVRAAGVPATVAREFERRCGPLTEDARRVTGAAAVLGREVDVEVLAEVAGLNPRRAEAAVEECLRGSVLRAEGPRCGFRHPLDRRAALARLSGPRLARLSLRAARALRRGSDGTPSLTELARLYRSAGRADEASLCLVAAADRAAATGDYTTATELYTRAIAEDPGANGRVRTAVKLVRTAQLARAGEEVLAAVRRVLDEDDPPPRLRGEIRLHLGVVLRNQSGMALDSLNEVARAVPDLAVSDPQTAARAAAVAAIPSIKGWPVSRSRAWLERCESLGPHVTDPVAVAAIAANRATALMLLGDPRCWEAAEALRGPAASAMEAAHHTRGWTNLAHAAAALGYGERAHEFLRLAAAGLADSSSPYVEGLTRTGRLVLAWHEGAWNGLHEAADRTAFHYAEIPDLTAEAVLVRGLTALHVLGDVPRARRDLAEAARVTCYDTGVILTASAAALARVHLEAGRPGQALDALEETLGRLARTGGWVWAGEAVPTAVEALHRSGQTARARHLVADFADGITACDAPAARAALTSASALLARAEGRTEEAGALLTEAATAWRLLGRPFDAARADEARGHCLLDLGAEGAVSVVQEVTEVYRELGARWDVARCGRLLRRHDIVTTHRRGRLGYGDQLSPREQEVAGLVVQGRANRDIAESLVLSTRTVEHHVARIMRKLNVTSRTDIALSPAVRNIPSLPR